MPTLNVPPVINTPKTTYLSENVTAPIFVTFCHISSHPAYERPAAGFRECYTQNSTRSHIINAINAHKKYLAVLCAFASLRETKKLFARTWFNERFR